MAYECDGKPLEDLEQMDMVAIYFLKSCSICWIENRLKVEQKPEYKGQLEKSRQQL